MYDVMQDYLHLNNISEFNIVLHTSYIVHLISMLKIGLTGGLGSGKSTVAHIFEVLGIPVYYADAASKRLMNDDEKVKAAVQNAFGKEVYSDGKLDRKYLAEIVFLCIMLMQLLKD